MNKNSYPFLKSEDDFAYLFISEGVRGKIEKGVSIIPMPGDLNYPPGRAYNLGFGDLVRSNGRLILDDTVRSGNGDMPKVIATVAQIAMTFLRENPDSLILFQGYVDQKSATLGRNHRNILYQRGIDSNWAELSLEFQFWGSKAGKMEEYAIGTSYDRILVKLK